MSGTATRTAEVLEPGVAEDAVSEFTPFEASAMARILQSPEVEALGLETDPGEPEVKQPAKDDKANETEEVPEEKSEEAAEEVPADEDDKPADDKAKEGETAAEKQARLDARFAELTARRKTAEEKEALANTRAETAEARLKSLETEVPVKLQSEDGNPLLTVFSHEKLEALVGEAESTAAWCRANPDGGIRKVNGKAVEKSAEEVATDLQQAQQVTNRALSRAVFIERFKAESDRAKTQFPSLFDQNSPDYARGKEIIRDYPFLATKPDLHLVIGKIIAGEKALTKKAEPAKAAPPTKLPPKVAPKGAPGLIESSGASRVVPSKVVRDTVGIAKAALKSGNYDNLNAVMTDFMEPVNAR